MDNESTTTAATTAAAVEEAQDAVEQAQAVETVQADPAPEKTYTASEYDAIKQELEQLRKEKLTQEERTRLELTQRETDVANREAVIRDKENRLHAIDALEQAQLVGGGITTADLLPFVSDTTTQGIDDKVKSLKALVDKIATANTQRIYQGAGRQPSQVQDAPSGSQNPAAAFGADRAQRTSRAQEIRNAYTGGNA